MQTQHPLFKRAPKPAIVLGTIIPIAIDNSKRHVLVRRPGHKSNDTRIFLARGSHRLTLSPSPLADDSIRRRTCAVDEVWVEDMEFVSLGDFGRGIIVVVVGLVVFVPFVAHLDAVEVAGLAGAVFGAVFGEPGWGLGRGGLVFVGKDFFIFTEAAGDVPGRRGLWCWRSRRLSGRSGRWGRRGGFVGLSMGEFDSRPRILSRLCCAWVLGRSPCG